MAKPLCKSGSAVVPGQKLCPQCRTFDPNTTGEEVVTDIETPESTVNDNTDVEYEMESAKEYLNSSMLKLDISLLKTHSVTSHSKSDHVKHKLVQVQKVVAKRIATVLSVKESELTKDESKSDIDKNNEELKARDSDHLVECTKKKLETANRHRKLQILTLAPKSWSIRKVAKEFGVSKKTIQKAKKLKEEKGTAVYPTL